MFPNLDAEQARFKKSNMEMAKLLNISRNTYAKKKKEGQFTIPEVNKLCCLFECKFEYLFKSDVS